MMCRTDLRYNPQSMHQSNCLSSCPTLRQQHCQRYLPVATRSVKTEMKETIQAKRTQVFMLLSIAHAMHRLLQYKIMEKLQNPLTLYVGRFPGVTRKMGEIPFSWRMLLTIATDG